MKLPYIITVKTSNCKFKRNYQEVKERKNMSPICKTTFCLQKQEKYVLTYLKVPQKPHLLFQLHYLFLSK
jgi:hypothetical protein